MQKQTRSTAKGRIKALEHFGVRNKSRERSVFKTYLCDFALPALPALPALQKKRRKWD